jgi:hypothetical protein
VSPIRALVYPDLDKIKRICNPAPRLATTGSGCRGEWEGSQPSYNSCDFANGKLVNFQESLHCLYFFLPFALASVFSIRFDLPVNELY